MINEKELKEMLNYDPENGLFTWKINKPHRMAGDAAGFFDKSNGYLKITINNKGYYAHRLAFLYMEGYLPENCIDHINRNKTDNRWTNLREVSMQCNLRNSKKQCNNSSGVRGVSWNNKRNKWESYIKNGRLKKINLGRFSDFDEAVAHRLAAEQCLGWINCDSASPAFLHIQNCLIYNKDEE